MFSVLDNASSFAFVDCSDVVALELTGDEVSSWVDARLERYRGLVTPGKLGSWAKARELMDWMFSVTGELLLRSCAARPATPSDNPLATLLTLAVISDAGLEMEVAISEGLSVMDFRKEEVELRLSAAPFEPAASDVEDFRVKSATPLFTCTPISLTLLVVNDVRSFIDCMTSDDNSFVPLAAEEVRELKD